MARISLVIPVLNEQESITLFYETMSEVMAGMRHDAEFVFVDDGSTDATLSILKRLHEKDPRVKAVSGKLSNES